MVKKIFSVILVLCCAALALAGCNPSADIDNPFESDGSEHFVTFESNGGSAVEGVKVRDGNPVRRPETPEKEGYFLIGWFTDNGLTDEWDFDKDRVNGDLTLYAGWKEKVNVQPTASLVYEKNGNAYTVAGAGGETVIVIPSEYEGLPVTAIKESAFARKDITEITIPDGVTAIERNAFNNCSELKTVHIGESSLLTEIGRNAFSGCGALEGLYIPATVTVIGDSAFNNCGAIDFTVAQNNAVYRSENGHLIERATSTLIRGGQSGEVPDGVTAIAQAAFRNATAVTELVIPLSVTAIGNYFIANGTIVTIRYAGTEEQWNAIGKSASMWNYGNRDVELKFADDASKILVVYFSATNNTERVAGYIAEATGGDSFELVPVNAYTTADLNYNNHSSRVYLEYLDENLRDTELVSYTVDNWADYDTVFIGYPIWWGIAAWPVNNFIKNNDFTGKTVIPFATSASSGLGQSGALLAEMAGGGNWLEGQRFSSGASQSAVASWANNLIG